MNSDEEFVRSIYPNIIMLSFRDNTYEEHCIFTDCTRMDMLGTCTSGKFDDLVWATLSDKIKHRMENALSE